MTESCFADQGNPKRQIASFRGFKPQNLAISKPPKHQNPTLAQRLTSCSRPTPERVCERLSFSRQVFNISLVDDVGIQFSQIGRLLPTRNLAERANSGTSRHEACSRVPCLSSGMRSTDELRFSLPAAWERARRDISTHSSHKLLQSVAMAPALVA